MRAECDRRVVGELDAPIPHHGRQKVGLEPKRREVHTGALSKARLDAPSYVEVSRRDLRAAGVT